MEFQCHTQHADLGFISQSLYHGDHIILIGYNTVARREAKTILSSPSPRFRAMLAAGECSHILVSRECLDVETTRKLTRLPQSVDCAWS